MNGAPTIVYVTSALSKSSHWPLNSKTEHDLSIRPRRLYLAGPIRGVDDFARRFKYSADMLRGSGYKVFNPVEQDDAFERAGTPVTIRHCLELDLVWICRWADCVAFLKGFRQSTGALAEFFTATACGIVTWELPDELQLP